MRKISRLVQFPAGRRNVLILSVVTGKEHANGFRRYHAHSRVISPGAQIPETRIDTDGYTSTVESVGSAVSSGSLQICDNDARACHAQEKHGPVMELTSVRTPMPTSQIRVSNADTPTIQIHALIFDLECPPPASKQLIAWIDQPRNRNGR